LPASGATTVSIFAPRDRHDALLRERVAPLVRELAALPSLDAVYFDRFNKPDWGLRIRVLGESPRLDGEARALVRQRLDAMAQPFAFVDDEAEDKWVGGPAEEQFLKRIHHLDSLACLDLLDIEGRAGLTISRAQWSLLVVERLLDLFGIHEVERLDFYRRGFQWAPNLGRWDAEVFAALERKFEAQAGALRAAIDVGEGRDTPDAWGGAGPAQIAARFLEAARGPVGAVLTAAKTGRLGKAPIDMALFIAHAHSNRLGIHPTQEGTIRYLVFRARGGEGTHAL
jgi:thiopeptide-type bacteriocin biosynthesis protein